jgi:hypothetical protein
VNRARFRHIGGMVIADHGPLALRDAAKLALFYLCEGVDRLDHGDRRTAAMCGERVLALTTATEAAVQWRRAAGWKDPFDADSPRPVDGAARRRSEPI